MKIELTKDRNDNPYYSVKKDGEELYRIRLNENSLEIATNGKILIEPQLLNVIKIDKKDY